MSDDRRLLSDDADIDGHEYELVVHDARGQNGDWYLSILPRGHKIGPTVRIRTSGGAAARHPEIGNVMALLFETLSVDRSFLTWPSDKLPRFNAGVRCDMLRGPCACGATHDGNDDAAAPPPDVNFNARLAADIERAKADCANGKHWFGVDPDLKPYQRCAYDWCKAPNPAAASMESSS